jgi:hypothetical protein
MSFLTAAKAVGAGWSRFLAHRATGWAFVIVLGVFGGFVLNYKNMQIALEACLSTKTTQATEDFADELKQQNLDELSKALADLDAANHPCLDWVYDPNSETRDSPVRSSGEGE